MDFEEQRQRANAVLSRKGYSRSSAEPPYGLVFRALGLKVRPLPFEPFWRIVLLCAVWFAPLWGLGMWFWRWREHGMSVIAALAGALVTGLCFGLSMACYTVWTRRRHGLPSWESLATPHAERDA